MEIILDPDHYENVILSAASDKGIFRIPLGPIGDASMHQAFLRGIFEDWWVLVDVMVDFHVLPGKDGPQRGPPMTIKVFKLTEAGWRRKRQLAIKFPMPMKGVPS